MRPEKTKWSHPDIGEFVYDGFSWTKKVRITAFKKFTYNNCIKKSDARVNLEFTSDKEDDHPTEDCVSLVKLVLENQEDLAPKIVKALWDDFNGNKYKSGMWWHSNLEEVTEYLDDPIESPETIYPNLLLDSINCYHYFESEKPIVELRFEASFEMEHGVGILTDGISILGVGYTHDVCVWEENGQDSGRYLPQLLGFWYFEENNTLLKITKNLFVISYSDMDEDISYKYSLNETKESISLILKRLYSAR